jgi:L-arabinonolactonase
MPNADAVPITCAVASRNVLGEAPIWDVAEQSLYWADIEGRLLQRFHPASGSASTWPFEERICAAAPRKCGGFVVALASGLAFFDPDTGAIERLVAPEAHLSDNRMNEAKCDRSGRLWAGTMNERTGAPTAALYRLDADLSHHRVEENIGISNGIAWSPDDRVFYFADTAKRKIFAYDFDRTDGTITNRRLFVDCADHPGAPDGSTVDANGFIWNAEWDGWRVVRYAPDGRIDRILSLPVQRPTSCVFGGADLSTLFVTSAVWDLSKDQQGAQPYAGGVLALDVGVRGLPECPFVG